MLETSQRYNNLVVVQHLVAIQQMVSSSL